LFPLISFQYVLHILGPIGIGKAQFAFSFAQYFTIIAAVGIPVYGVREVARCKQDQEKLSAVFTELVVINIITSLALTTIYLIIIYFADYFKTDKNLYLAGVTLIFFSFSTIDWFYTGLSNFRPLAIRSFITKSVSLLLLYLLVKTGADYYRFFLLTILGVLGGNLINILLIRHQVKFSLNNLNLSQHITPLLLVFGVSIGASMYTVLDTVLLGFLTHPKFVGLYTCAVKFAKMFMPFIMVIGTVLMPEISKKVTNDSLEEAQHLLKKSFEFIVFFSVPVSVGFFVLAPEFIAVFSGSQFAEAVVTMQILSALPLLLGLGYFFAGQILFSAGRYKEVLISTLIGLSLFVLLNILLVPRFLHNGAAIANVIAELVVTLSYLWFIKKNYTIHIDFYSVIKAAISSLLFVVTVYYVRSLYMPAILTLIISTCTCIVIYLSIQWFVFKNEIIVNLSLFLTGGLKRGIEKIYK
jgi:O-antigen/teichoic acid export membrane protein